MVEWLYKLMWSGRAIKKGLVIIRDANLNYIRNIIIDDDFTTEIRYKERSLCF
jgi:hypothetical protein